MKKGFPYGHSFSQNHTGVLIKHRALRKLLCYVQRFQEPPNFSLQPLIQVLNQTKHVFISSSPAASQSNCLGIQALKKYINLLCKSYGNMSNVPCSDMYTENCHPM